MEREQAPRSTVQEDLDEDLKLALELSRLEFEQQNTNNNNENEVESTDNTTPVVIEDTSNDLIVAQALQAELENEYYSKLQEVERKAAIRYVTSDPRSKGINTLPSKLTFQSWSCLWRINFF